MYGGRRPAKVGQKSSSLSSSVLPNVWTLRVYMSFVSRQSKNDSFTLVDPKDLLVWTKDRSRHGQVTTRSRHETESKE